MPPPDSPAPLVRRPHLAVLLVVLGIAGALFYQYRLFFHDDAYISLRYAQTFLSGGGLCWNPGERVEGYTNFLFVILTAAMGKCGVDLVVASRIIGIGSYLLLVAFSARRFLRTHDSHSANWLALVPVIISTTALPVIIWTLGGLETTLFALLVTIGAVQFSDSMSDSRRSLMAPGLWFGLATLCRPEGILFVALGAAFAIVRGLQFERKWDHRLGLFVAGAAMLVFPHAIWRFNYYHSWLPNTFYVKASNLGSVVSYGWEYAGDFCRALPLVPLLVVIALFTAVVTRTLRVRALWFLSIVSVYGAYIFAIGGDHMPGFRLFSPLIPVGGYLLYELLSEQKFLVRSTFQIAVVCAVLLLCAGQLILPTEEYRRAKIQDGAAFLGKQVGKYINSNWPSGSLVALNTAGSTPYFAPNLRFIDMLGLNDSIIARRSNVPMRTKMQEWPGHQKGDGLYVLSRKPDYIIIGPANGDYANNFPWFLSDYELGGSELFLREYEPVKVIISASEPGYKNYTESALGALRFVYYQRKK